jgi:hypothetical protein
MVFFPYYYAAEFVAVEFGAEWQDFACAVERIGFYVEDSDMLFTLCAFSLAMTASPFYV